MYYYKYNLPLFLGGIFLLLLVTTSVQAQLQTVQIEFQILEDDYRDFYGDSLPNLLVKGKEQIATILQSEFPFAKFGSEPSDNKLIITIDRQKTGIESLSIHQIDVNMTLITEDGVQSNTVASEFRGIDRFDEPLPNSNAAFLVELSFVLADWLKKERSGIVLEVMSHLSLAKEALPDKNNESWIFPFSEETLNIGMDSEFVVKSKLETPDRVENIDYSTVAKGRTQPTASAYPPAYRGKIFARLKPDAISNLDKMTHNGLKVEGIYLIKYIRSRPIPTFSPDDFEFASN